MNLPSYSISNGRLFFDPFNIVTDQIKNSRGKTGVKVHNLLKAIIKLIFHQATVINGGNGKFTIINNASLKIWAFNHLNRDVRSLLDIKKPQNLSLKKAKELVLLICDQEKQRRINFNQEKQANVNLHRKKCFSPRVNTSDCLEKLEVSNGSIGDLLGAGKHKNVYKINGTDFVVKVPKSNLPKLYRNEYFAYLISEKFGLNAVPFVALVNDKEMSAQKDFSLKKAIEAKFGEGKFAIIQKFIPNFISKEKIELNNAHRVLFFNMLIGRADNKSANSMADTNGYIFEVDNDILFSQCTSMEMHWLMENKEVREKEISPKLLQHILELPQLDIKESPHFNVNIQIVNKNVKTVQLAIQTLKAKNQPINFINLINFLKTSS